MKNSSQIDTLIDKIDFQLILLRDCMSTNKPYKYFNFHGGVKQLIDLIERENLLDQYLGKLGEYQSVFYDLFDREYMSTSFKVIAVDKEGLEVTIEASTVIHDQLEFQTEIYTIQPSKEDFRAYKEKSIEELNLTPTITSTSLYDYILSKSKVDYGGLGKMEGEIRHSANLKNNKSIFIKLGLPLAKISITLDQYVEDLKFQWENLDKALKTPPVKSYQSNLTEEEIRRLTAKSEELILQDKIDRFDRIERKLYDRGYLDESHHWKSSKKKLIDFVTMLDHLRFFKPIVNGKRIKDFHKRQFISEHYGGKPTGLTETFKKYKPTFTEARIPYSWMEDLK